MHDRPQSQARTRSATARTTGHLIGVAWFVYLTLSGDDRPTWLRAVYGTAAAIFLAAAAGTVAEAVRKSRRTDTS
ncbi:hypothetical protein ACIPYS_21315 [Kitasatospora sp. NPDC089913]|uniref:hypothetical protein n=1 Tax=Kitasatospora sp. NPDC089913 TaxID=3364080 RepID=UPI00381D9265